MLSSELKAALPSTSKLPCSDDIPVDNEDQNLLPNVLLFLLQSIWQDRLDWYFGVDMAIYHTTGVSPLVPVVPDAFLSLDVERKKDGKSRKSYATWEEEDRIPLLVLEMVSHTPGGEYDRKLDVYRRLGVLYYLVYNPEYWRRDRQQPFELYKLVEDNYQIQIGEPFWLAEIGLGIGRVRGVFNGIEQEQLAWFDRNGIRYLTDGERANLEAERANLETERADIEANRADRESDRAEKLAQYLRALGVDPNNLPDRI
jgi:Uma2 family endonuclease